MQRELLGFTNLHKPPQIFQYQPCEWSLMCCSCTAPATHCRYGRYWLYRAATHRLQHAFPDAFPPDEPCSICMEGMTRAKQLPCGHLFHLSCLRAWVQQGGSHICPNCRQPMLQEGDIHAASPPRLLNMVFPLLPLRAMRRVQIAMEQLRCRILLSVLQGVHAVLRPAVWRAPSPSGLDLLEMLQHAIADARQVGACVRAERGQTPDRYMFGYMSWSKQLEESA